MTIVVKKLPSFWTLQSSIIVICNMEVGSLGFPKLTPWGRRGDSSLQKLYKRVSPEGIVFSCFI